MAKQARAYHEVLIYGSTKWKPPIIRDTLIANGFRSSRIKSGEAASTRFVESDNSTVRVFVDQAEDATDVIRIMTRACPGVIIMQREPQVIDKTRRPHVVGRIISENKKMVLAHMEGTNVEYKRSQLFLRNNNYHVRKTKPKDQKATPEPEHNDQDTWDLI